MSIAYFISIVYFFISNLAKKTKTD